MPSAFGWQSQNWYSCQVRAQFEAWSKQGNAWRTFSAAQPIEVLESQLLDQATVLVDGAKVRVQRVGVLARGTKRTGSGARVVVS